MPTRPPDDIQYLDLGDYLVLARNGQRFVAANVDATIDMMVRIAAARRTWWRSRTGSDGSSTDRATRWSGPAGHRSRRANVRSASSRVATG
jgi:hypothetical protein